MTSAYRNPRVNRAVGGVPNSDHALGWACDFQVPGQSLIETARKVRDGGMLVYDQLIYEPGRCVHISFNPRARGQVLTQRRLGGRCEQGINP